MAAIDLLGPLVHIGGGAISVKAESLPVEVEPRWVTRTIAVSIVKQTRANLNAGKGPDGTVLPPLKNRALALTRAAEQAFSKRGAHAKRGIASGLLIRSIKSRSEGINAVVYVEGPRGETRPAGPFSVGAFTRKTKYGEVQVKAHSHGQGRGHQRCPRRLPRDVL